MGRLGQALGLQRIGRRWVLRRCKYREAPELNVAARAELAGQDLETRGRGAVLMRLQALKQQLADICRQCVAVLGLWQFSPFGDLHRDGGLFSGQIALTEGLFT